MIYGHGGNDIIYGGNGTDTLYGGNGTDTLYGGLGSDVLSSLSFVQGQSTQSDFVELDTTQDDPSLKIYNGQDKTVYQTIQLKGTDFNSIDELMNQKALII